MVDLVSVGEPLGRRRQRLRQQQQQRVLVFTLGGAKGLRGSSAVGGYLRPQPPALWMFGSSVFIQACIISGVHEASVLSRHILSKDPDLGIKITKGEEVQRVLEAKSEAVAVQCSAHH